MCSAFLDSSKESINSVPSDFGERSADLNDVYSENLEEDSESFSPNLSTGKSDVRSPRLKDIFNLLNKPGLCDLGLITSKMVDLDEVELIIVDGEGQTIIDCAAVQGHYDFLNWFSKSFKCVSEFKEELFSLALCTCAKMGLLTSCQKLLKLGANLNFEKQAEREYELLTPLGFAVVQGHIEVVTFFLTISGVDVNHIHRVQEARESLLHLGVLYPEITRLLLAAGADPYLDIQPTRRYTKAAKSAVHETLYEACYSHNWALMEPYLDWEDLCFHDYEDGDDIVNPFIKIHLDNPKDVTLIALINRLHTHPKIICPLHALINAIDNHVKSSKEILHKRCELIENQFNVEDGDKIRTAGQVSTRLQMFGRTIACALFKKQEWTLAVGILEKYKVGITNKTHIDSNKQVVIKDSVVDLIIEINGLKSATANLADKINFVRGFIHYKAKGAFAKGILDYFMKASKVFAKARFYLSEVLLKTKFFKDDTFIAICYSAQIDKMTSVEKTKRIAQLITQLVYRAKRHDWNKDPKCQLIRNIVEIYNPFLNDKGKKIYEKWIHDYETETHDYYGRDLSDNSDAEEETHFTKQSPFIWHTLVHHFEKLIEKAEGNRFAEWLVQFERAPLTTDLKKIAAFFHQSQRAQESVSVTPQIERDLHTLNVFASQGRLEEGIKSSKTRFVIAQYRGISHDTSIWSASARRAHRKKDEEGLPYYSAGVYDLAQVRLDQDRDQEIALKLAEKAEELKVKLLEWRKQPPIILKKRRGNPINYETRAHQIQEIYSRAKIEFMALLPELKLGTLQNPFVSMGDTPFHALKYAYGIKPYAENRENRLRPRWNKQGIAERPYSGKVYLSLHPLEDYGPDGPLHVPSLYYHGMIDLDPRILNERETTFPAYLPDGRLTHTYIAKYPSFDKPYKSIYLYKYGLKQDVYIILRKLIKKHAPHTPEQKAVKAMLGEYLCAYHEIRLQEKARELVKRLPLESVLIYRSEIGGFTLTRPVYVFPNNPGKSEIHKIDRDSIKRRRTEGLAKLSTDPFKPTDVDEPDVEGLMDSTDSKEGSDACS